MKVQHIEIHNYRNLDGVQFQLHPEVSFLVGESDLGKSNFLDLLDTVFNRRSFDLLDFYDQKQPIRILLTLSLSSVEQGTFEDIFDPLDSRSINLIAYQASVRADETIRFFRKENFDTHPIELPTNLLRQANFIHYDPLRVPQEELNPQRDKGGGKVITHLIGLYLERDQETKHYLVDESVEEVLTFVKDKLNRIAPLRSPGVSLSVDEGDPVNLISRVTRLYGANGFDIRSSGYGVQFSALVMLSILERLVYAKQRPSMWQRGLFSTDRVCFDQDAYCRFLRRFNIERSMFEPYEQRSEGSVHIDVEGMPSDLVESIGTEAFNAIHHTKHISLVLGLDEPGIHLHPYRQRALMKYLCSLLENQDSEFLSLLEEIFGVDEVHGQAIVVSHSPATLLNDYRHIVRFAKHDSSVRAISGMGITLDDSMTKHLWMNFPYIKEAFFSRCIVLVEGVTEAGALPLWGEKLIGDLDECGITVLYVGGKKSVLPVQSLLNQFGVANIAIVDADDGAAIPTGVESTHYRDFEEELYEAIYAQDNSVTVLFNLLENYEARKLDYYVRPDALEKTAQKYRLPSRSDWGRHVFKDVQGSADQPLLKAMFLSWLTLERVKSYTFGRLVGSETEVEHIPRVYIDVLQRAKEKAT